MSRIETPLQAVKRLYGSKDKLVDEVSSALRGAEEDAAELKARLLKASNKKLLKLGAVAKQLKERFGGSKDKLVESLGGALGRAKDGDYLDKLRTYSPARLLDMLRAAEGRTRKAA